MPKANIVFTMAVQLGAFNAVFKVLFFGLSSLHSSYFLHVISNLHSLAGV